MKTSREKLDKEVLDRGVLTKGVSGKDTQNRDDKITNMVQKQRLPSVVDNFVGKDICVMLRSGNKLECRLESVTQYEIVATLSHQPVIIMKHAIDYIGLVSKN